jgi:CubicO group peptidase (beta-lactamase class C family)
MLPLFKDLPAKRPPGAAHEYPDTNYIRAGLVIETVSGKPFVEAADEVRRPTGMNDSGFDALDEDPPRLAT